MIARPFSTVGFSFVFALLTLNLVEDSAAVLTASAVGCILISVFVKALHGRAEYIVCALSVIAASISFTASEKLVYSPTLQFVGEDVTVDAAVNDIKTASSGTYYILDAYEINGVQADCKLRLYQKEPINVSIGGRVSFVGDISPIGKNEEAHRYYKSDGIFLSCSADGAIETVSAEQKTLFYYVRPVRIYISAMLEELVGGESGAVAVSMLTGDKGLLSSQTDNAFKVCGLSHTLAVSGLHMNIIVLALYKAVSRLFPKAKRLSALLCIPIALLYVALTGFSVSAVRACIMITVMLSGRVLLRKSDSLNSLGLAALIIALINPYSVLDWSFMLSFSSTLGIVLAAPLLKKADAAIKMRVRRKLLSAAAVSVFDTVAVSCVATAFTLPVMILFVGSFSLVFAPANLAVFWAVPMLMVSAALTVLSTLLPVAFPAAASSFVCRWTGRYILAVVEWLSQPTFARVSVSSFAMKLWLAGSLAVIALVVYLIKNKKKAYVFGTIFVCVSLALTCAASAIENRGAVKITAVNVEDGVCSIVSYGTSAVLIGCSGDSYTVDAALEKLGVTNIELVIFPMSTKENSNCLKELCDGYTVRQIAASPACVCPALPDGTLRDDSFSFDFHSVNIGYTSIDGYDFCTLESDAGSALFVFGTDTPQIIPEEALKTDFLFSQAQPPLWLDTSDYAAVVISAGGNTLVNSTNAYSTYDNSNLTLVFNKWRKYTIDLL